MKKSENSAFLKLLVISFTTTLLLTSALFTSTEAAEPVMTLKFSWMDPVTDTHTKVDYMVYVQALRDAAKGKIEIEEYYAQTLNKGKDAWEAVRVGIADMAPCYMPMWPGMTPLMDVVTLPFIPYPNSEKSPYGETSGGIYWKLFEKYASIQKQFKDNHVMVLHSSGPYDFITANKQVRTLDDIKGLRLRVSGTYPTKMLKMLEAVPVAMTMGDVYDALTKGVLDGYLGSYCTYWGWRNYENCHYVTQVTPFMTYFAVVINHKTWARIPDDVKKAWQNAGLLGYEGSKYMSHLFVDVAQSTGRRLTEERAKMPTEYKLPESEKARMREKAGKPIWDEWLKDMKAKGYNEAKDILDDLLSMCESAK